MSEANLEPERLAKPISRAEHQRAIGVMVRSEGSRQRPPAHRRMSEANLKPERLAEPISRAEHRRVKRIFSKNNAPLFF